MPRKGASAVQVWTQVPVASRTVGVTQWSSGAVPAPNQTGRPLVDLTHWNGVAVPSGGFSVRASSSQRATAAVGAGTGGGSITIASVTTTRASQTGSCRSAAADNKVASIWATFQITAATTVTFTREGTDGGFTVGTEVWEVV